METALSRARLRFLDLISDRVHRPSSQVVKRPDHGAIRTQSHTGFFQHFLWRKTGCFQLAQGEARSSFCQTLSIGVTD